jgi:hypothetical protein
VGRRHYQDLWHWVIPEGRASHRVQPRSIVAVAVLTSALILAAVAVGVILLTGGDEATMDGAPTSSTGPGFNLGVLSNDGGSR